jgi:serine/threonine protein kinase
VSGYYLALFNFIQLLSHSTRSEKRVFLAAARERHPFLLGLHSCFQTETRVYFVMEYVSGGDLMLHIQRKQFSLRQAKFYASEVLLALEYFHANGIIYRYAHSQCSWRAQNDVVTVT